MNNVSQNFITKNKGLTIPKDDFILAVLFSLLFFFFFSPISYLPDRFILKYVSLLIVGLYLLSNIKVILQKKYFSLNFLSVLFVLCIILFAFINRNTISDRNPFFASIVFSGYFLETLFLLEIFAEKNKIQKIISLFYNLTIITLIITDFLIFFVPSVYKAYGEYLIGTKFQVSYLHAQLIVLFLLKNNIKRYNQVEYWVKFLFYWVLSIFISVYVNCNTGLLANVLLGVGFIVFKNRQRIFSNPVLIVLFLLICCSFLFFADSILKNEYVQYFIVDVLHRDLTLTGRTNIYEQIFQVLDGHWLMGYGYGSSYEVCTDTMGYANTQNGLLNWILECGILVAVLIVAMLYVAFSKIKKCGKFLFPSIICIYVYSLIASVEVTINAQFLFWILFIFTFSSYYNSSKRAALKGVDNEKRFGQCHLHHI